MSAFRKLASQNIRNIARNGVRAPVVARNFSSVIERKEHADEARFIRETEQRRKDEMRANLERILAAESHVDKEHIENLLGAKKDVPEGFAEKFGLNDWRMSVPVSLMAGVPLIISGGIILDAEAMLTTCFFLFMTTMYNQVGPMIAKSLDAETEDIYTSLKAADEANKLSLTAAIEVQENALSAEEDSIEIFKLTDNMNAAQAEWLTNAEKHHYRDAVVKKLDALSALEESASNAIRARMISKVQADVLEAFKTDKKVKENALNQAIAVLAGGANAKLGKDVVGELFQSSLVNYKDAYAKLPVGADEILVKLEEDIKAISSPPVVTTQGGNVYLTHPLIA